MNDGNDDRDDLTTPSADDERGAVKALNEGEVVDDTDIPVNPDEKTVAETEAAYDAVHYGRPDRRKYRGPRSIALLVLVVAAIVGLGIYAVMWSDGLRKKNEKIELRVLEERHVMSKWQQQNAELKQKQMDRVMPGMKMAPANSVYKPLSEREKARYDLLMAQYGTQFQPDENEKALIAESRELLGQNPPSAPATAPATDFPKSPAGAKEP